jgi:hypothetical protein
MCGLRAPVRQWSGTARNATGTPALRDCNVVLDFQNIAAAPSGMIGRMAWIQTIDKHEATGALLEVYTAAASRPLPPAYRTPHGGAPGIRRAHSLDPALMLATFTTSSSVHMGEALSWAERELIAASASRLNQCLY